jgi:hypothetical protein
MDLKQYFALRHRKQLDLARQIGVVGVLVNQWQSGKRRVPDTHCPAIELATEGVVTCEELRPDVPWTRIPDATWPHPKGRPLIDPAARRNSDCAEAA